MRGWLCPAHTCMLLSGAFVAHVGDGLGVRCAGGCALCCWCLNVLFLMHKSINISWYSCCLASTPTSYKRSTSDASGLLWYSCCLAGCAPTSYNDVSVSSCMLHVVSSHAQLATVSVFLAVNSIVGEGGGGVSGGPCVLLLWKGEGYVLMFKYYHFFGAPLLSGASGLNQDSAASVADICQHTRPWLGLSDLARPSRQALGGCPECSCALWRLVSVLLAALYNPFCLWAPGVCICIEQHALWHTVARFLCSVRRMV